MHTIEQKILQIFARDPHQEYSTTMLVRHVFPNENAKLSKQLEQDDRDTQRFAKRQKARLHRKLLYHLNKLQKDEILLLRRVEGKGEKFYSLNPNKQTKDDNDEKVKDILESVSSHLFNNDNSNTFGLASYEEKYMVKRFDEKNWSSKLNALLIETEHLTNAKELYDRLLKLYPIFNDVIGLNGFEKTVDKESIEELTGFLRKIAVDTSDYGKQITLLINLKHIKDSVKLSDFLKVFSDTAPENIFISFLSDTATLDTHHRLLKQLIRMFSTQKIRINLQNTEVKQAPLVPGRAGMYGIDDEEWKDYETNYKDKLIGICLAESSLYIDMYHFQKEYQTASEFRDFILKTAKALITSTTSKRRMSDTLFSRVNRLNAPNQSKFFKYSKNHIRLWNYNVDTDEEAFDNLLRLLQGCSQALKEFSKSEETIFKSCGIPIYVNLWLSSTFTRFDRKFLSPRKYTKFTIKSENDLHSARFKEYIDRRMQVMRVFKNIDRVRFFRNPNFAPNEVLSEFLHLFRNGKLPFFAYDFRARKGELTLNDFFG